MKKLLICLVIILGWVEVIGQRIEDMTQIPAAPQTTSLFKAVAAPVSYYTGQPDVTIPIYTISQDGVEVPVSITFNTSGIFVTEEATNIGLGIRLNWGGSIVRSANGRPDEKGFFTENYEIGNLKQSLPKDYSIFTPPQPAICFPYCGNPSSLDSLVRRMELYHSVNTYNDPYKSGDIGFATDLRPDDFFYNVLGKSGLFRFNQADRKFLTFPLDDIKIDKTVTSGKIQKFEITKSDGVKIILGDEAVEYTHRISGNAFDQSWFIKKITTIKNTSIDFSYMENQYNTNAEFRTELRIPYPGGGYNASSGGDSYITAEKLIQTISFEGGRLDFLYIRDRTDLPLNTGGLQAPRLHRIVLYDNNNKKVKVFQFYQSYFTANPAVAGFDAPLYNNRLRLDSLSIQDTLYNSIETFRFEYHTGYPIPSKKSLGRDHWGYYNGVETNTSLIPSSKIPLIVSNGDFLPGSSWSGYDDWHQFYISHIKSNRYINSSASKTFTLKKIKFPTGGERQYDFEDNEVSWYELFSEMKDISNDGFDVITKRFMVNGSTLSTSYPEASEVNSNGTIRTVYSDEFVVDDFNDLVLGEPSVFIRSTFVNTAVTISQLNLWDYKIEIGLQLKSGGIFSHYSGLFTIDRNNYSTNTLSSKLPVLTNGTYRIYVKMSMPPSSVMSNWYDQFGNPVSYSHNTVIGLAYRKKNFGNIRVGGLRIKEIIDREGGNEYKDTYSYVMSGDYCSGHLVCLPEYKEPIVTVQTTSSGTTTYSGYRLWSEACLPITKTQGSNVGYTHVTKKTIGGVREIKEEFIFSYKPSLQSGYLKEYYKESEPRTWQNGKLLSAKRYSDNTLIQQDTLEYYGMNNETDKGFVEEINTGLIVGSPYVYAGFEDDKWQVAIDRRYDNPVLSSGINLFTGLYSFDNDSVVINHNGFGSVVPLPPVKIPYFRLYSGFDQIKSKTIKNYSGVNVIVQKENYFYDSIPNNLALTRVESSNSKGETLTSKFYYPQNFSTEPFMAQMITANRTGSPIKTEKLKNGVKVFEEKFIYSQDASTSNLLLPKSVYSATFPNTLPNITTPPVGQLEKQITYDLYDSKGNLLQYQKESEGFFVTLLWDYDKTYPVAECRNADAASIAYTSFEADGKGGWLFSGTPTADPLAVTGQKAYNLNGSNNILKTGLSSENVYILSYWTKNASAFSVAGTQAGFPVAGKSIDGWKRFEHRITGQTQVVISGTGWIDEVSLHPANAEMKTYTYEPLKGISSASDVNRRIIYYVYDNSGRLAFIRDDDNNIVKKICYNYAGQPIDCDPPNIHVKWSFENIQSGIENGVYVEYADFYLRCYDANGQPVTLTTPLNVSLNWYQRFVDMNGNVTASQTDPFTFQIANGTNALLMSEGTPIKWYNVDGNGNRIGDQYECDIKLSPSAGYFIKP